MENQHRKIKGYRELNQNEIDLMNEIKEQGVVLDALVKKVTLYLEAQNRWANSLPLDDERERLANASPILWSRVAKTHLQQGLMELTRSIAQPGFF